MKKTLKDLSYQVILKICNEFVEVKNEIRAFSEKTCEDGKKGLVYTRTKYPLKEYFGKFKADRFKKVFCVFQNVSIVGFAYPDIDKKEDSIDSLRCLPCQKLRSLSLNHYFKDNFSLSKFLDRFTNLKRIVCRKFFDDYL